MFQLPTLTPNPDGSVDLHIDALLVGLVQSLFARPAATDEHAPCSAAGALSDVEGPDGQVMSCKFDPWHPGEQGPGAFVPLDASYTCPPGAVLMRHEPTPRDVDVVERAS